jgi:hypothetical protein
MGNKSAANLGVLFFWVPFNGVSHLRMPGHTAILPISA